ncbi:SGNH hydrolase-type esterase domain-containing protein [Chaetomium tenue]|uniref:SGNH hydrolase-type esterase domain-containing protein n=1 Tax=Chaetomium tenue TaxID=1854479 RepID=A0ACB7P9R8_9PEZI|nr:SGNH hydrolase-type esterase domain-containing protein [Chaetomium globosum]
MLCPLTAGVEPPMAPTESELSEACPTPVGPAVRHPFSHPPQPDETSPSSPPTMVSPPLSTLLLALAAPLAIHGAPTPTPTNTNTAPNPDTTICSNTTLAISLTLTQPLPSQNQQHQQTPLGNGVPLRIMPLGASITYGTASTDGNGYRSALRNHLISGPGNKVNMVGTRQAGSMRDSDVEGWPGFRIAEVRAKAMAAGCVPHYRPNVVLVNAGTNDATQNFSVDGAGARMEELVRGLWAASPRAVVVLSTLLVNRNVEAEKNVRVINAQYVDLARRLREGGRKRLVLVDMHGPDGPTTADLADDTHPNDGGYRKMADIWFKGLVAASDAGWLQAPEPVAGVPDDGAA